MSVLSRCGIRLTAGVAGVLVALALVAAPAAWAQGGTTITAAANVQFNGVVDNDPECSPPDATGATIHWGDGTTSAGRFLSDGEVSGTHMYAGPPASQPTIVFAGDSSCTPGTDDFTATVGATPQFTECPQVGDDTGCQFLIVASNSGTTIDNDASQTAYENSDDSLIGVLNNSSDPITSIPLSAPGTSLFGFDGDGICDVFEEIGATAPIPVGCQQIGGAAAGTPCDPTNGNPCAYPLAPGNTSGDPDAYSGSNQNGYEGPTTFFTNLSTDASSGVVDFSPALQPGQSTYFSLEEPPVSGLAAGGGPQGGTFTAPPTVTATGASFSALVNPNGSATNAYFQYGLDAKYTKLGASGPDYTNTTPAQSVGGDFANHSVTASVSGLVPNALYHVRLVATNSGGTTYGPDITFTTNHGATPGNPTLGRNVNISLVSGLVLIKVHGKFIPLTELTQIPTNTEINALHGTIKLITAVPAGTKPSADIAAKGKGKKGKGKTSTQNGTFGGAIFKITQAHNGLATLALVESAFKGAPSYSLCTKHKAADASAAALSSKTLQLLHASAKGRFTTKGKYSSATVRGTKWTIADKCNGTLVHDVTDSVSVTNFVTHKTVILHAGQSYLAAKP
jgi:hypothetical protein